jgi:orotidine-5'-phosphate decarboxylase
MTAARDRLALALDVGDLAAARAIAKRCAPWFATVKVGLELYAESGPDVFTALHDDGFRIFADLKLHDIPTTVHRAARAIGRHGVEFLNLHAAGGVDMLRAGAEGLREGAADAGFAPPIALGVTVLTSDPDADAFAERLMRSHAAGCEGVVCSAHEARAAHEVGLRAMVPGIRLPGDALDDQARVATPDDAVAAGADWLVIGRSVTRARDPAAAAAEITRLVEGARGCV